VIPEAELVDVEPVIDSVVAVDSIIEEVIEL
jgi:hypothetical protein